MRTKYVGLIRLPADLYERLEERALAEERDPLQQARWLLRQALMGQETGEQDTPQQREASNALAR